MNKATYFYGAIHLTRASLKMSCFPVFMSTVGIHRSSSIRGVCLINLNIQAR